MRKLLISIVIITALPVFAAGRKVVIPGKFYRVDINQFTLSPSRKSGLVIELIVALTSFNTSRTVTGTLTLLPQSQVVGNHGTTPSIPGTVAMYIATNRGCASTTPSSSGAQFLNSSLSQTFALQPNQMSAFAVGGTIIVNRTDAAATHFFPSFSIEINENDGAVVGSINPHVLSAGDGWGTCVPGHSSCAGSNWVSMKNDFLLNTTPIPILGGRPF